MARISTLLLLSALFTCSSVKAANWYLNAAANGANTGTSWTDGWSGTGRINWSLIAAGDTLWFAGGTYNPFNWGRSGTPSARIYMKRARSSDSECTSAPGWKASYDSQVTITVATSNGSAGIWVVPNNGVQTDYVTIDGQVPDGIKFPVNATSGIVNNGIISVGHSNIIQYIEVAGNGVISGNTGIRIGDEYHYGTRTGAWAHHNRIHHCSNGFAVDGTDQVLIEDNDITDNYGDNANHDNICYVFSGSNGVWRNNRALRYGAEGLYFAPKSFVCNNWRIYGNIFDRGGVLGGFGIAFDPGGFPNSSPYQFGPDWFLYNNTFRNVRIGIDNRSRFGGSGTTGGFVRNNIFWGGVQNNMGTFTVSNNFSEADGSNPFVSPTDYHLTRHLPGANVGSEYSPDPDGVARVSWDIGAYELGIVESSPGILSMVNQMASLSESAGSLTVTVQRTAGTTGAIGVSYSTSNGTATAGVNYTATSGTLSWADSDAADKSFAVPISNTSMVGNKSFSVVLSSPTGGASLGSATTETVTLIGTGVPPPPPVFGLSFEAEAGTLSTPVAVTSACGRTGITQSGVQTGLTDGGLATYRFSVPTSGQYKIQLTYSAPDDGANSFFLWTDVDPAPTDPNNITDLNVTGSCVWATQNAGWRGTGTDILSQFPNRTWTFPAGTHTLNIRGREPGTLLDKITIIPLGVIVGVSSATSPNGAFMVSEVLPITVTFTAPVFVTGSPRLFLNSGGVGVYVSGSGTTSLLFNYTVALGQNTQSLDYVSTTALSVNGGTIKDGGGASVNLTLSPPGQSGSLSYNSNIIIDTIKPVPSFGPANLQVGPTGTDITVPVGYADLNFYRTTLLANQVVYRVTGTVTGTLSVISSTSSGVQIVFSNVTGDGTFQVLSLPAGTAEDTAGNLAAELRTASAIISLKSTANRKTIRVRGIYGDTIITRP